MSPSKIVVGRIYKGPAGEFRKVTQIAGHLQSAALAETRWAELQVRYSLGHGARQKSAPLLEFAAWALRLAVVNDVRDDRFDPQGK